MGEMIEIINTVLRFQMFFKWPEKSPYYHNNKYYKNSFEYHVQHHPKDEKETGKWDSLINYANDETISNSYYKTSVDLSKKFALISKDNYDIQYIKKHDSVNIVNMNNGLIVCLKYNKDRNYFDIASCFFPSKINKLLSIKHKIFSANNRNGKETNANNIHFTPYMDNNTQDEKSSITFEEAMREFFGIDSIQYKILFENETNNINVIINDIVNDTTEYLNYMESLIKDEDDKKYYFVFNDGIEYVVKLSLLYKIKDKNYEKLYQRFLNIDINNVYKDALDECKRYIDEGELHGKNN